jgi:hypothetical protein
LAELEERGFGWDLGYMPSSLEEFLLALIHPPSGRVLGLSEFFEIFHVGFVFLLFSFFIITTKVLVD